MKKPAKKLGVRRLWRVSPVTKVVKSKKILRRSRQKQQFQAQIQKENFS